MVKPETFSSRRGFIQTAAAAALGLVAWPQGMIPAEATPGPRPAADLETVRLDCTPQAYPALSIRGEDVSRYPGGRLAGFRGFADPCIRRDPAGGDLWLVYSWPHMEHLGAGKHDFAVGVETHLARSADGGRTWQLEQVLWPKTPARFTDPKTQTARDGFISHEVPNILPCSIDDKPAWVGVRLDYFLGRKGNYKDRDNFSFCLRIMDARHPKQLASAPYASFGHDMSSRECAIDWNLCDFSKDFPVAFIPNEPALFYGNGRLYLVFVCMTFHGKDPDFPKSFIAVFSTEPSGPVRDWKWRYHGKLASHLEARELGGEALTQIELALARDGQLLAFLTPESWNPGAAKSYGRDVFFGIMHHGCAVVEVASLDTPALARRSDGRLAQRAFLYSSTQKEHGPGAAAYDPSSATGILFTLRDLSSSTDLSWTLHPTGFHP